MKCKFVTFIKRKFKLWDRVKFLWTGEIEYAHEFELEADAREITKMLLFCDGNEIMSLEDGELSGNNCTVTFDHWNKYVSQN